MSVIHLSKPIDYDCPPWCERPDHHADLVDADNPPCHYGPECGFVASQGRDGELEAQIHFGDQTGYVSGPSRLRELAADLVRAAEWMEAHQ